MDLIERSFYHGFQSPTGRWYPVQRLSYPTRAHADEPPMVLVKFVTTQRVQYVPARRVVAVDHEDWLIMLEAHME